MNQILGNLHQEGEVKVLNLPPLFRFLFTCTIDYVWRTMVEYLDG
ncbi:hypothetical protein LCGC14_0741290 [marine sediment metagenome]|uniref:Uncharacterized protein n=1 Tax=marine sediment metagenome TaxID=412755 RepID=A0A0F9TDU4_9ZZZZ